jgi:molybdenum cofactor cytidylyltransferase
MTANKLGAILLAAGGSSRLGRSKQLLKYRNETLLRRAARSLADSVYFPVVVVLGAEADAAANELEGLAVYGLVNAAWADGMSSSIRAGLEKLLEIEPDAAGVLISLCDQPKITTEMLNRFAGKFCETNGRIIASAYEKVVGVPALFSREVFKELLPLESDKGAREIIRKSDGVVTLELPEAAKDIDTDLDAIELANES